jgi:hypothetical protein
MYRMDALRNSDSSNRIAVQTMFHSRIVEGKM